MLMKCKTCTMNEQCICIPDSDECAIRTDAYNKGIEDFIENLTLPILTEEQLESIVEQLQKK